MVGCVWKMLCFERDAGVSHATAAPARGNLIQFVARVHLNTWLRGTPLEDSAAAGIVKAAARMRATLLDVPLRTRRAQSCDRIPSRIVTARCCREYVRRCAARAKSQTDVNWDSETRACRGAGKISGKLERSIKRVLVPCLVARPQPVLVQASPDSPKTGTTLSDSSGI